MDKIEKKYREEPNNKLYIFTIVVTLLAILIWSSSVVNFDNSARFLAFFNTQKAVHIFVVDAGYIFCVAFFLYRTWPEL